MRKTLLIVFLCKVFLANAQDTLVLSLTQVIDLNKKQNLTIKENNIKYNLAKASFYSSIGKAIPSFGMGIKRYELSGFTQSTEGDFIDVDKDQEWIGKSFQLSWDLRELFFNLVSAKQKSKAAFYSKNAKNEDENIRIYTLYFMLVSSYEKEKAINNFISKNTEIVKQLQLQVASGLRLESELLLAQTNLNNLKIKLLEQQQRTVVYNQELLAAIDIDENIIIKTEFNLFDNYSFNISFANIEEVLYNRFELQQLKKELSAAAWQKNKQLYGLLIPKITFGMNDGLIGPINQNAFGDQNILSSSLMWNIPLGKVFPSGDFKYQRSLYQIKKIEKERLENQLRAELKIIITAYKSADEQYKLAKESAQFAKTAYKQSLQRQQLGTANQLELFHAEKEYLNAQLIHINSIVKRLDTGHKQMAAINNKVLH